MKIAYRLTLLIGICILTLKVNAQDLNLIGRANLGIGFDYLSQDFNGINTKYSPGGGLGFEAGLEGEINDDLFWYGTVGITFNLNLHYEEVNGVTRRTSFSWNKKFFTAGANKYFEVRSKFISDFYGGGGLTLGIPGILRRTVNGNGNGNGNSGYLGRIKYKTSLGFQLHGGATLAITDGVLLRPELRYRFINYKSKSFSKGSLSDLEPGLKKANGQGVEISVTIVKQIRGGRR
ncbi:MAG: hypothetical protein JXR03_17595 [Cyclobacteriaceae bacterium]